jgi:hypothetical protein
MVAGCVAPAASVASFVDTTRRGKLALRRQLQAPDCTGFRHGA